MSHEEDKAPDVRNNFTPRAQQVLALSRREADRFHHNFVGTEHLLLGLIALGQGTAVNVLLRMGVDLEKARAEVERHAGTGPDQKVIGNIPYTPRVRKVLALAAKEARALNHTYVGTEHILLGLLSEGDGVAARTLQNLSVDINVTRQFVLKELDPNLSPEEVAAFAVKVQTPRPLSDTIDVSKRYDVYCREGNEERIYRNARFKGRRKLFEQDDLDAPLNFVEIEEADGSTVFVSAYSIVKVRHAAVAS